MNNKLSKFPGAAIAVFVVAVLFSASANADDARWMQLKSAFFADKEIVASDHIIELETPARAYDAAVVPVVIRTTNQYKKTIQDASDNNAVKIKKIHLIVDQNPLPLAGVFNFNQSIAPWDTLETNIRINEYTDVRAIAEMTDGTLHMSSRFVKASGGCSAPAMADLAAAIAKAGQLDILLGEINQAPGDVASSGQETVLSISHPNNSGMQFDQVSRNYIPAFFITEIGLKAEEELLLDVETNFSLSENPIVKIAFSDGYKYNSLVLYAIDSKGSKFEKKIAVDDGRATLDGSKSG